MLASHPQGPVGWAGGTAGWEGGQQEPHEGQQGGQESQQDLQGPAGTSRGSVGTPRGSAGPPGGSAGWAGGTAGPAGVSRVGSFAPGGWAGAPCSASPTEGLHRAGCWQDRCDSTWAHGNLQSWGGMVPVAHSRGCLPPPVPAAISAAQVEPRGQFLGTEPVWAAVSSWEGRTALSPPSHQVTHTKR